METLSTTGGNFTIATTDNITWSIGIAYPQLGTLIGQEYKSTKEGNMRGLFRVFAVDPKEGRILVESLVVAKDEDQAILKALTESTVKVDLERHDVHAFCYGMFIRAKKEIQKVEMVKEGDD